MSDNFRILSTIYSIGMPGNPEDSTNGNIDHLPENGTINKWHYRGRPEEKSFLYEIVANKISGKNKFQEQKLFTVNQFSGCFKPFDII